MKLSVLELAPPGQTPMEGSAGEIVDQLASFAAAGADEIIVIANPINERSVRGIGVLLPERRNVVN